MKKRIAGILIIALAVMLLSPAGQIPIRFEQRLGESGRA